MTKYNITPKEKKAGPSYRSIVQPEIVEETAAKIISRLMVDKNSEIVGTMRIFEAKYMLGDANFANMKMEDIAINVGFTTRQSFYATFYKLCGITPKEYRKTYGTIPEPKPAKPKKKNKAAIHNKKTK